jgi:hypothetical protein
MACCPHALLRAFTHALMQIGGDIALPLPRAGLIGIGIVRVLRDGL